MATKKTTKIGRKYVSFYYFKQKPINWEYVSVTTYNSVIPSNEAIKGYQYKSYLRMTSPVHQFEKAPITITYYKYFTSESYLNKQFFYDITVSNDSDKQPLNQILKIYNDPSLVSSFSNQYSDNVLDSVTTLFSFTETIDWTDLTDALTVQDSIQVEAQGKIPIQESHVYTKEISEAYEFNLFDNVETITDDTKGFTTGSFYYLNKSLINLDPVNVNETVEIQDDIHIIDARRFLPIRISPVFILASKSDSINVIPDLEINFIDANMFYHVSSAIIA